MIYPLVPKLRLGNPVQESSSFQFREARASQTAFPKQELGNAQDAARSVMHSHATRGNEKNNEKGTQCVPYLLLANL